jgi:hypothetical protein
MNSIAHKTQSMLFASAAAVVSLACIFVTASAFVVTARDCQVLVYSLMWQIRVYFGRRTLLARPRESNHFLRVCDATKK